MERGQAWVAALPGGLEFRLDPEGQGGDPQGWTIRITPVGDPASDYVWVATPPYRFSNPRYLDTGYGVGARAALAWTPREFAYVWSAGDFEFARRAVEVILWPGSHTPEELAGAEAALQRVPTYPGRLRIEDGAAAEPNSLHPWGIIESISFRVELCLPTRPTTPQVG